LHHGVEFLCLICGQVGEGGVQVGHGVG
jgi:hypothetical protein